MNDGPPCAGAQRRGGTGRESWGDVVVAGSRRTRARSAERLGQHARARSRCSGRSTWPRPSVCLTGRSSERTPSLTAPRISRSVTALQTQTYTRLAGVATDGGRWGYLTQNPPECKSFPIYILKAICYGRAMSSASIHPGWLRPPGFPLRLPPPWPASRAPHEYPIGKPQLKAGMEIAAVYLQPVVDGSAGDDARRQGRPTSHLEADIQAHGRQRQRLCRRRRGSRTSASNTRSRSKGSADVISGHAACRWWPATARTTATT